MRIAKSNPLLNIKVKYRNRITPQDIRIFTDVMYVLS